MDKISKGKCKHRNTINFKIICTILKVKCVDVTVEKNAFLESVRSLCVHHLFSHFHLKTIISKNQY